MHTTDDALVAMLDELAILSGPEGRQSAVALRERLATGDLRVALVGEAKRGKSTLGNALLGHAVLPTGVVPVTAVSTEVRAGAPSRAEVSFTDGTSLTIDVDEVDQFVSERHNADNHRRVDVVRIYVPEGMPHPRMVLLDTPGVGSVHAHNTAQAEAAFTTMDAAVFVLTADPPISASELALLRQVAALAVRVFVVLNKADQLESDELAEALDFVSAVVAGPLGSRTRLWACSAREGLRARRKADEDASAGSGVPAFRDSLLTYLVQHRERDLRASIAFGADRLATRQLDEVSVTLATVQTLEDDHADRVRSFSERLSVIDRRREEAVELVTVVLARERSRLDAAATAQVALATMLVRQRLEEFFSAVDRLEATELEHQGRAVIAAVTYTAVEEWRAQGHQQLREAVLALMEREQRLLAEVSGDLQAAARDLLGVQLHGTAPVLVAPEPPRLRYDFDPEFGWNQALVSGLRTRAPGAIAKRRIRTYLRAECERLVDKHVGRARAEFQNRLEEAARSLRADVTAAFAEMTAGLRSGHQAALDLTASEPGQCQRQRLVGRHDALARLAERLREATAEGRATSSLNLQEEAQ